jgi:hypothetical protein
MYLRICAVRKCPAHYGSVLTKGRPTMSERFSWSENIFIENLLFNCNR